jgi:hypothetical protein
MGVAQEIAAGIGEVLGLDENNDGVKDPRFCVGIPSGQVINAATNSKSTVLIDYNYLPIRCRACGDTKHCLKDCALRAGNHRTAASQKKNSNRNRSTQSHGQRGANNRPDNANTSSSPSKQPEVDNEGFQRPKHKGWRHPGPNFREEGNGGPTTGGGNSSEAAGGADNRNGDINPDARTLDARTTNEVFGTVQQNNEEVPQRQERGQQEVSEHRRRDGPATGEAEDTRALFGEGTLIFGSEPEGSSGHSGTDNRGRNRNLDVEQNIRNNQVVLYNDRTMGRSNGIRVVTQTITDGRTVERWPQRHL